MGRLTGLCMKKAIILVAVVVVCGACLLLLVGVGVDGAKSLLAERAKTRHVGSLHAFRLSGRPGFLAEDLALAKAQETLALDGFDPSIWQPQPSGRTRSPDGRTDAFMTREIGVPTRGVFVFTNGGAPPRVVHVGLDKDRLLFQGSGGKK